MTAAASDPDGDPIRYNLMYSDKYISGSTALHHVTFNETGPGSFSVTAPQTLGVWKVYVYAFDGHGNVGIETRSFRVVPPPVSGTDVALNRPTTASSYQQTGPSGAQPPNYATDGNLSTRWASDWSDPQWIQVDLGQVTAVNHIQLVWEAAYATAYQIQFSADGTNWTTAYSTSSGDGGVDDIGVDRLGPLRPAHRHPAWHRLRLLALGVRRLPLTSGAAAHLKSGHLLRYALTDCSLLL